MARQREKCSVTIDYDGLFFSFLVFNFFCSFLFGEIIQNSLRYIPLSADGHYDDGEKTRDDGGGGVGDSRPR